MTIEEKNVYEKIISNTLSRETFGGIKNFQWISFCK